MKVININWAGGQNDLVKYGKELLDELTNNYEVQTYLEIKDDFSNIPELFDDSEKMVLMNQWVKDDSFKLFTENFSKFNNIKYMLTPYSSYAGLDIALLKKAGIKFRNNGGANARAVAQYSIMAMFMLLRKFPMLTKTMKPADGTILGEEFNGKKAGIIGMGNIGQEILEILNGLGIETVYYNRTDRNVSAKKVEFKEIFDQDIIFTPISTNPDTKKVLADLAKFLKPHNYLIDPSAEDDLYDKKKIVELLNVNKLKGYAVETIAPNDLPASDGNLVVTPHIAWTTIDAEKRTVENYLNRALTILKGKASEVDFIV